MNKDEQHSQNQVKGVLVLLQDVLFVGSMLTDKNVVLFHMSTLSCFKSWYCTRN